MPTSTNNELREQSFSLSSLARPISEVFQPLGRTGTTATGAIPLSIPAKTHRTRLVVVAASLGTVFEWYDFYLYGSLAVFFSILFFPPGNDAAAFLASLATFGAGFAVRPLGALVFGALG